MDRRVLGFAGFVVRRIKMKMNSHTASGSSEFLPTAVSRSEPLFYRVEEEAVAFLYHETTTPQLGTEHI